MLPKKTVHPPSMLAPAQTYCRKMANLFDQIKSRTTEEEFVKWFKPIGAARIRRQDASSVRAQHELRLSDREALHSVPAADHLPALRTGDPPALRRSQKRRTERASVERSRYDGDFAVQHPDQHGKYKKSVRHSGSQEDRHRPAAQPELHVRNLHRRGSATAWPVRRVWPSRSIRAIRLSTRCIYTATPDWARPTSCSRSATKCGSAIPNCRCFTFR